MKNVIKEMIARAGGATSLARKMNEHLPPDRQITRQAVYYWLRAEKVTAELVLAAEKATGISRHDISPDLYPRDQG